MANRRQRAKRAATKKTAIIAAIKDANHASEIAKIVRTNKSRPIERNYYATVSNNMQQLAAKGASKDVSGNWSSKAPSREGFERVLDTLFADIKGS